MSLGLRRSLGLNRIKLHVSAHRRARASHYSTKLVRVSSCYGTRLIAHIPCSTHAVVFKYLKIWTWWHCWWWHRNNFGTRQDIIPSMGGVKYAQQRSEITIKVQHSKPMDSPRSKPPPRATMWTESGCTKNTCLVSHAMATFFPTLHIKRRL